MVKTAVQRKPSAPVAQDDIERSLAVLSAKKQFVFVAMNMGWQLAGMVLIPVIIGVKLDERFDSSPSYTLASLVVACGGAIAVVRRTIVQVNRDQEVKNNQPNSQVTK